MDNGAEHSPFPEATLALDLSAELDAWLDEDPLERDPQPTWPKPPDQDPWVFEIPELDALDEFTRDITGQVQGSEKTGQRNSKSMGSEKSRDKGTPPSASPQSKGV